jgi:hypothetical protein
MNAKEANLAARTSDIYERLPGYESPPLAPFNIPTVEQLLILFGIRSTEGSRWFLDNAARLSGYSEFCRQLAGPGQEACLRTLFTRAQKSPQLTSATVVLEDDVRCAGAVSRSVTLLLAARELLYDLKKGNLAPNGAGAKPCEMGQLANGFATSLVRGSKKERIFKSACSSRIAVCAYRQIFLIEAAIETWSAAGLTLTLKNILKEALAHRTSHCGAGVITACEQEPKLFRRFIGDGTNAKSLELLKHSFITLCLDVDEQPLSAAEAGRLAHSANAGNRWFYSSLQLVVFGNGKACAICAFEAYLDGNTMGRISSELQQRGKLQPLCSEDLPGSSPGYMRLRWKISRPLLRSAGKNLRTALDSQESTFELPGLGTDHFRRSGLKPVPCFVVALQLTFRRVAGQMAAIRQFLDLSRYRCLGVAAPSVATEQVRQFVEELVVGNSGDERRRLLLNEAICSQVAVCHAARQSLPLEESIALFAQRHPHGFKFLCIVAKLLAWLSGRTGDGPWVYVSHPAIYPGVLLLGRPGIRLPNSGFLNLHYQMWKDKTVVTIMPSTNWHISAAEFSAALRHSLEEVSLYGAPPAGRPADNSIDNPTVVALTS